MGVFLRIGYLIIILLVFNPFALLAQSADKSTKSTARPSRLIRKAQRQDKKARTIRTRAANMMKSKRANAVRVKKLRKKADSFEEKAQANGRKAGLKKHLKSQTRSARKRIKLGAKKHKQYKRNSKSRIL